MEKTNHFQSLNVYLVLKNDNGDLEVVKNLDHERFLLCSVTPMTRADAKTGDKFQILNEDGETSTEFELIFKSGSREECEKYKTRMEKDAHLDYEEVKEAVTENLKPTMEKIDSIGTALDDMIKKVNDMFTEEDLKYKRVLASVAKEEGESPKNKAFIPGIKITRVFVNKLEEITETEKPLTKQNGESLQKVIFEVLLKSGHFHSWQVFSVYTYDKTGVYSGKVEEAYNSKNLYWIQLIPMQLAVKYLQEMPDESGDTSPWQIRNVNGTRQHALELKLSELMPVGVQYRTL